MNIAYGFANREGLTVDKFFIVYPSSNTQREHTFLSKWYVDFFLVSSKVAQGN